MRRIQPVAPVFHIGDQLFRRIDLNSNVVCFAYSAIRRCNDALEGNGIPAIINTGRGVDLQMICLAAGVAVVVRHIVPTAVAAKTGIVLPLVGVVLRISLAGIGEQVHDTAGINIFLVMGHVVAQC